MRDHLVAADLQPGEWPAIVTGDAGIDARETAAVGDLDSAEAGRVRDNDPLCAVSGKDRGQFLLLGQRWRRRLGGSAERLRIGIGLDEATVP